ncbi:MAG: elongation factor P--(R)-beta-lysine ligase [Spirochaetales bacterium]|nr:elongation factor P--(R)-beta-lysine ligase [Spirochaetales bacterium]
MDTSLIRARSRLYRNIREFFDSRGYLEVETPCLAASLIPEPTIKNFSTLYQSEYLGSREMYLVPSPEVFIKRLIARGCGNVYEICKCFRNAEQIGSLHNPEFSMLEYYTMDFDEKDSIALTQELLRETALPGCPDGLKQPFEVISMAQALNKATGLELEAIQSPKVIRQKAHELGVLDDPSVSEGWDDTFNRLFLNFVEPSLRTDVPVVLTGYPAQIECLAQNDGIVKRRWELYFGAVEIANCYLEETSPERVRESMRREFARMASERALTGEVIPDNDPEYWRIFRSFPRCSGVALGLDRLLMLQTGRQRIDDLILFGFSDIL